MDGGRDIQVGVKKIFLCKEVNSFVTVIIFALRSILLGSEINNITAFNQVYCFV